MKLPNYENAIVPQAKVTQFADALARHAAENEVAKSEQVRFGTRYVIDGIIHAPDGRTPNVRSVWFIEQGEPIPRFVTAYPLPRRNR